MAIAAKRVENLGEVTAQVIEKFRPDPFERFRLLYQRELRPIQWEWFFLMDQHPDVLVKACPRVGKSVGISLKNLDDLVMNPHEELMIFAPKHDQAVKTWSPAFEVIEESPFLQDFLRLSPQGKPEYGKGFAKFINRSNANTFGVLSNFEGENATIIHADELDDIPPDSLKRMFGRGIGKNKNNLPTRHRLSGVIWGKLNIFTFDQDPHFQTLPAVDVHQALAAGLLDEKSVQHERARMTDDQWLRTMCLKYVESRNLIWEIWLKVCQYIGLKWNLVPIPPMPGSLYQKVGKIAFGLDMGHQGAGSDASDYSLQVTEAVGKYRRWLWGRTWPPDTDPAEIIRDVCEYWRFYRPDVGYADALDANLVAQINSALYEKGLVKFDWKLKGRNMDEGWREWFKAGLLTPIHNSGRTKHYMYMSIKSSIFNALNIGEPGLDGNIFCFPMASMNNFKQGMPSWIELQYLLWELANLTGELLPSKYLRIERYRRHLEGEEVDQAGVDSVILKDDRTDGLAMSHFALDALQGRMKTAGDTKVDYIRGF